jgi:hypothetical protein
VGDTILVDLPEGTTVDHVVSGVDDLSRARSLFSSRRGGDLETFIYVPHSVIVSPEVFAATVFPAFDRASTASLTTSALTGTLGGYLATGAVLYLTGRRTIDREINDDRRRLTDDEPLWRRARLDLAGLALLRDG